MRNHLKAALGLFAGALLCLTPQAVALPGTTSGETARTTVQAGPDTAAQAAADPAYKVLVFSRTAGFRHSSIDDGITALRSLGTANNFTVDATEDPGAFTAGNLAQYKAVVFLSTTGDVLGDAQQTAFERYLNGGGGYVGIHAAADTEYDWPFYEGLAGALFHSHPAIQSATVEIEDRAHDATAHLGTTWQRTDEWYNYRTNPRTTARVLASLDESSYSGGNMNGDHPIAWCKDYEGGRAFYTGGGHTDESYTDAAFRRHLLGGIRWAAGMTDADCRPESGYTSLFDGSGTTGWQQAGPGGFTLADGTLTSHGGLGMLWYAAEEFTGDYSLKLDWKAAGDDNSGVFVGFPASGDPWSAVNNGYEIQIDATDAADRTTGAVYGFRSADLPARDAALNPPGEWNTYELRVTGERLEIFLNGSKINDFTNTDPARSLRQGHIGLQNHGDGDEVAFRDIRVKRAGTPPTGPRSGAVKGVNGKCLDVDNAGTADGTKVQVWTCNGSAAQSWTVAGDGALKALGKCLDVSGGGSADGTRVQLWTCNGSGAQRWAAQSDGTVRNPQSGKCLDASGGTWNDGTAVHLWSCHTGPNQKWTLP
ncbi:putative secreted glycosyl hydrolase [Streptomyces ambofaciens ATCC 23877]|uniref:Putative secreted glycosyl hydrolase n=1 Tax=Streptomyces ambofaciens (strain ATCC 23877 / 3486 / DSM 40053 / JCM 4204 / NBRC 12836 / NRRL B-2516) TaxID=278992 RepID=A0ACX0_STRA7|nr:ThuA domain-containing protein [Streptomyces ambofaciens]AKZ60013.1 putative secreted glycosyl hydrolase [Streptomyces ambofaciens ATCC 23877]CAJ88325.1 putative secreted glycosyl hydrolase [Streptomyces ambofaciens ATCC 23877]